MLCAPICERPPATTMLFPQWIAHNLLITLQTFNNWCPREVGSPLFHCSWRVRLFTITTLYADLHIISYTATQHIVNPYIAYFHKWRANLHLYIGAPSHRPIPYQISSLCLLHLILMTQFKWILANHVTGTCITTVVYYFLIQVSQTTAKQHIVRC